LGWRTEEGRTSGNRSPDRKLNPGPSVYGTAVLPIGQSCLRLIAMRLVTKLSELFRIVTVIYPNEGVSDHTVGAEACNRRMI
jgi:hypothetical protein